MFALKDLMLNIRVIRYIFRKSVRRNSHFSKVDGSQPHVMFAESELLCLYLYLPLKRISLRTVVEE